MIKESQLAEATKKDFELIGKIAHIIRFLLAGNELEHKDLTYKMDGDFNLYIPFLRDKDEEVYPVFQNESCWDVLVDVAENAPKEQWDYIRLESAIIATLNNK